MINKKILIQWLAPTILVIFAVLLIWQLGSREDVVRPASHEYDDTLTQNKTDVTVIANTKPCMQLPIQIGKEDFTPADNALRCILTEYTNAVGRKDKERILALDTELKELVYAVQSLRDHDAWKTFWRNKEQLRYQYQKTIGVYIDDKSLRYDGGLRYDNVAQSRTETLSEFDLLKPRFEQIRAAFLAIPKTAEITNIEALYKLDEQLEDLVSEANGIFDGSTPFPTYPEIGAVGWQHLLHRTNPASCRQAAAIARFC